MQVLSKFKLARLLWLFCALMAVGATVLATPLLNNLLANIESAQTMQAASHGVQLMQPLTKNLAVHRGLTNRIRNGDQSARAKREDAANIVHQSLDQLARHYQHQPQTLIWLKGIKST